MNNLHLRYKLDTGLDASPEIRISSECNRVWSGIDYPDEVIYPIEYVEWLERELELLLDGRNKG